MENISFHDENLHFNKADLEAMVGSNQEFIDLLISTFIDGYHKYLKNIYSAVANKDAAALKLNAHSIHGSAQSVCFPKMAILASELENTDISEDEKAKELIEEIENEFVIISEILNKY
jgi:HPt (histidine-containing phosphotransfer) domain-containing protein